MVNQTGCMCALFLIGLFAQPQLMVNQAGLIIEVIEDTSTNK